VAVSACPALAQTDGFGPRRAGPGGEVRSGFIPDMLVQEAFKELRGLAETRASERLAATRDPAARATAARNLARLQGLSIHTLETNDVVAERVGSTVRISHGLLTEIYTRSMKLMEAGTIDAGGRGMFQMRVLSLILAHEVARAGGLRASRAADAEALRLLKGSTTLQGITDLELREAVRAFDRPTGSARVDTLFTRMRNLFRYGTPGGRVKALERASRCEPDPLARFRRGDGTVRWGPALKAGAVHEANGASRFVMALFLKELAVVAATGDRLRIEEFFDALLTTDFYERYGLFVGGARLGEVAYTRYLKRYVKPSFVSGVLKTQLTLAAGLALPMIVNGEFSTKTLAISLTSLGLSTAAVRGGVRGISWVVGLDKAKQTGMLGKVGAGAGRLARLGGWFYAAAELGVILYASEQLDRLAHEVLDLRAARGSLADAGLSFVDAARDPAATPGSLEQAAADYRDAWTAYRNFLYRELDADEARLAARLKRFGERAAEIADLRCAALERVRDFPRLCERVIAEHGSLEAYAEAKVADGERALAEDVSTALAVYARDRAAHLREVYEGKRRPGPLLDDPVALLARPEGGDLMNRIGRGLRRRALRNALERASTNRLQTYEDEAEVLRAVQALLPPELGQVLDRQQASLDALAAADARLYRGGGALEPAPARTGAVDALRSQ